MHHRSFKGRGETVPLCQYSKKINKYCLNYDSTRDEFKCPLGHVLSLKFFSKHRVYRHDDKVCTCCKLQKKCVTKRGDRPTVYTDEKGIIIAKMKKKIKKNSSKEIYAKLRSHCRTYMWSDENKWL